MSDPYRVLHYRGDRTVIATGIPVPRPDTGPVRTVPLEFGSDALGAPYEVLDADYDPATDLTTVHLQPATADTRRGNLVARRAAEARNRAAWGVQA